MSPVSPKSRVVAAVLGAALIIVIGVYALGPGLGDESVPDDAIAVVDGEAILKDDFDRALMTTAKAAGMQDVPAEGDPQYEQVRDQALSDLLDLAWIKGEAAERGVEATPTRIEEKLQETIAQNFKDQQAFDQFVTESGLTDEDVNQRIELQILSEDIQKEIAGSAPEATTDDVETYYEANKEQYKQPETRDVRFVRNQDPAKIDEAMAALQADDSDASWKRVATEFSDDKATVAMGGLRQGITGGLLEDGLNDPVFDASEGELGGPVTTDLGTYVFEVVSVTPSTYQPLSEASAAIKEQLTNQFQQETFTAFLSDYRDRWIERTICADDFLTDRCDNFEAPPAPCPDPSLPAAQQDQQLKTTGCPPPVLPTSPGAPGSFLPFVPLAPGAPQRPHPPGADPDPNAQPIPTGLPPGVQGAPPGTAPPPGSAPPPSAAPPPGQ